MSRLPRLKSSSPDRHTENVGPTLASAAYVNTRKRKSTIEEDEQEDTVCELMNQPRKMAATGNARPTRSRTAAAPPLNPSRNAGNLLASSSTSNSDSTLEASSSKVPTLSSSNFGKGMPKPLATRARPPPSTITRSTRGASAPPVSSGAVRVPVKPSSATTTRTGRSVSGSLRPGAAAKKDDPRFNNIQSQLASIEAARKADADRLEQEMAAERAKVSQLQNNHLTLSKQLSDAKSLELNQRRELVNYSDEMDEMRKKHGKEVMEMEMEVRKKDRELRETTEDLRVARGDLDRERMTVEHLRGALSSQSQSQLTLSAENEALRAQLSSLQRTLVSRNIELQDMRDVVEEKEKLVVEMKKEVFESETIRRKLHNMVLELKGNIRVFCRVRPVLPSDLPSNVEKEEAMAKMAFPDKHDHKDIVLYSTSESAMGVERKDVYNFGFDRVFEPESTQAQVFEEISQLAQSCIDGYNVCIFAYGQTGSGKSFTMEGGPTEATAGMIPRAVEQVFRVAEEMKNKGWEYKIEGQFLEIYNETIHDLLTPSSSSSSSDDKKKHDIKHDPKTGRTTVTEATTIPLHSPSQVKTLLTRAQSRRSVAATLMNERSSRSHSVFTLRISGVNVGVREEADSGSDSGGGGRRRRRNEEDGGGGSEGVAVVGTGERCEGCLNLVDLAGSERLNVSFGPGVTEKERVRETQSINKSLSALGDVIAALGEKGGAGGSGKEVHIPYRNSKLTYLLQNSLSGNSKTLMVLNLSPLAAHLNESLTSLRFATKVNSTTIGTARKAARTS